ncbi:BppU family phage baseplate upper protein, partial [Leuconostoc mesenteroides]|uniref:BppU family phage baseplate upper protein n=1 Tax=Leuconostoc mesenteroides TaxID=1245 RepID=UPI0023623EA5
IWFQQSGQPLALDGYTVEWAQTNADGKPLVVSGTTISGAVVGQMIFYFPANAFAVAGAVIGHFLIKKESDGSLISSIDLSFDVKKDNVLMNIDTTPFMNDWEQFKSRIKS